MRLLSYEAAYLSLIVTFLVKSLRVIMTSSSGCVFRRCPNVNEGSAILSPYFKNPITLTVVQQRDFSAMKRADLKTMGSFS